MTDSPKDWYLDSLSSHADAIRRALDDSQGPNPESVRRLAASVQRSARRSGEETLARIAGRIRDSDELDMRDYAEELHDALEAAMEADLATERPTVLVIDDDMGVRKVLAASLSRTGRRVLMARDLEEARNLLATAPVDLVVLDLHLASQDGRTLITEIRERRGTQDLPVVVLSVEVTSSTKSECYALGADTYLEKPVDQATLSSVVASLLSRRSRVADQLGLDSTTGLPNAAGLNREWMRLRSEGRATAVGLVDIDHLARVNRTHGPHAGDDVLTAFGVTAARVVGHCGIVGRWRDDELAVAFLQSSDAFPIMESLVASVREIRVEGPKGEFGVTCSAGLSEVAADWTLARAVAEARVSLEEARMAGRNRVAEPIAPASLHKSTVAVFSDRPAIARRLRARLEPAGLQVVGLAGAPWGRLDLDGMGFQAAVVDSQFGGRTGVEVAEAIAGTARHAGSRILHLDELESESALADALLGDV